MLLSSMNNKVTLLFITHINSPPSFAPDSFGLTRYLSLCSPSCCCCSPNYDSTLESLIHFYHDFEDERFATTLDCSALNAQDSVLGREGVFHMAWFDICALTGIGCCRCGSSCGTSSFAFSLSDFKS